MEDNNKFLDLKGTLKISYSKLSLFPFLLWLISLCHYIPGEHRWNPTQKRLPQKDSFLWIFAPRIIWSKHLLFLSQGRWSLNIALPQMYPVLYDVQSVLSSLSLIQWKMIQRLSKVTQLVNGGTWTRTPGVMLFPPPLNNFLLKIIFKCYLYNSEQKDLAMCRNNMETS